MNKFGTREEICVSGSVFVFAGVQQNKLSSFINKGARLNEKGLMRGSFASQPDEATGAVQRYATEGTWKQRFLHIEFDSEGFTLSLFRPSPDRGAARGMGSSGVTSPASGSYLPSPADPSTPREAAAASSSSVNRKEGAPLSPASASMRRPTSPAAAAGSASSFFGALRGIGGDGGASSSNFSNQLRQLTAELDLGDPEHDHIVENRLFREQIRDRRASERSRFVLPEGMIKLRKVYLASRPFNSVGGSSTVADPVASSRQERFLFRHRSGFTGEQRTVDHAFAVQLYMDGAFLEFVGRTDDNSHLWFQRLQLIIAVHNAYARVKKMLLNRQSFPVLPGRDEFPVARLVRIEESTGGGNSLTNNASSGTIRRGNDDPAALTSSKSGRHRSPHRQNSSSSAQSSSPPPPRVRHVLQMVLCKMSLAHSRKGFDLTIVGKAVSGQQLFWRVLVDDVPVIHEADQYATISAVPLSPSDMEALSLGTEPADEAFLLGREPEVLRLLRGGEAAERVGKGTGGLFYLNKWANFLSVFSRLYSASHPTAFQKWGGDEDGAGAGDRGGGDGGGGVTANIKNSNAAAASAGDGVGGGGPLTMERLMEEEARLNASFLVEERKKKKADAAAAAAENADGREGRGSRSSRGEKRSSSSRRRRSGRSGSNRSSQRANSDGEGEGRRERDRERGLGDKEAEEEGKDATFAEFGTLVESRALSRRRSSIGSYETNDDDDEEARRRRRRRIRQQRRDSNGSSFTGGSSRTGDSSGRSDNDEDLSDDRGRRHRRRRRGNGGYSSDDSYSSRTVDYYEEDSSGRNRHRRGRERGYRGGRRHRRRGDGADEDGTAPPTPQAGRSRSGSLTNASSSAAAAAAAAREEGLGEFSYRPQGAERPKPKSDDIGGALADLQSLRFPPQQQSQQTQSRHMDPLMGGGDGSRRARSYSAAGSAEHPQEPAPLQRQRSRHIIPNGSFAGADVSGGSVTNNGSFGFGERYASSGHTSSRSTSANPSRQTTGGGPCTDDYGHPPLPRNNSGANLLSHHHQHSSSQGQGQRYAPAAVPGAASVPGLADLSAGLVRRINSFKNIKEVAHEAVGLSEADARLQASLGTQQRQRSGRSAGIASPRFLGDDAASMDAIAGAHSARAMTPRRRGDVMADGSPWGWDGRERSYSTAVGHHSLESADPAERLAALLQERGVANVTVESAPVSTRRAKEAALRSPTPRSYFQRDERALIESMPLLFLEGRHEDAMFAIMGFWQKYPPLVPPAD